MKKLNKEIAVCAICNKEIRNETLMNIVINDKEICCDCIEKIVYEFTVKVDTLAQEDELVNNNDTVRDFQQETNMEVKSKFKKESKVDILKTIEDVKRSIKGQDEFVKRIIYALLKNQRYPNRKSNIMVVGNSGMGKTQTLKTIFEVLDVPFVIEDITSYSEVGYVGKDVDELIDSLCSKYQYNKEKIENSVIVIDEFDKLAACGSRGEKDVSGLGVQKSLLKLIEGKTLNIQIDDFGKMMSIDTSKITFIFLGVFPEIRKIRKDRLNLGSSFRIGFSEGNEEKQYVNSSYISEDFEKAGFMTEIIGRIKLFIEARDLNEEDFYEILTSSELSSLKDIREEFENREIKLCIAPRTLKNIAKKALSYKMGARAINTVLEDTFCEVLFEIDSNPYKKYNYCRISTETVEDNTKYVLN